MRWRCKYHPRWKDRGITVCERWLNSFKNFLADMGPRPSPKHSIDRKKNSGNYEPGNCRWATPKEQHRNKRSNRLLTHNGITLSVTEWAEKLNVKRQILFNRLNRKFPIEKVLC